MQLEELNKTQIVLLTLLVSFVTSIATGIITVTLMDQAPPGVTQTINRVVERTVEVVVPEKSQGAAVTKTVVVRQEDFIVDATKTNASNLVSLSMFYGEEKRKSGLGFVVTSSGIMVTNAQALIFGEGEMPSQIMATTNSGETYEAQRLPIAHKDLVFLKLSLSKQTEEGEEDSTEKSSFTAPSFITDKSIHLGQTAIALGLEETPSVSVGFISRLAPESNLGTTTPQKTVWGTIYTTLDANSDYFGGPLLSTSTDVLGIVIASSKEGKLIAVPAHSIVDALNAYNNKEKTSSNEEGGQEDGV